MFQQAVRHKARLRMALDGPSGSGKTLTALRFAQTLGSRIAVIDTEYGSASKYAGDTWDGKTLAFMVAELTTFAPTEYTQAIASAERAGAEVLVIDSLSHAWEGKDGALELVDKKAGESRSGNSFMAWKDVTPLHRRMVDAMLASPMHVIVTMRTKSEWVLEENERGKKVPRKIGMAPVQRQGMEYEFDIYGNMDLDHSLKISKTRCSAIDGVTVIKPGAEFMAPVLEWLGRGADRPAPTPATPPPATSANGTREYITDDQAAILTKLIQDTGTDIKKFLGFYAVSPPVVKKFPAIQFEHACNLLNRKLAKQPATT